MASAQSPAESMRAAWRRLSGLPGGKWVFSRFIGRTVPYSGSIDPRVVELRPGYARVIVRDRRKLRNHLGSVHAIALANMGELSSGLAMTVGLPAEVRGIVTALTVQFTKKARGVLTAECDADIPHEVTERTTHQVVAVIRDEANDEVARVTVDWLLDIRPTAK
jgi:acyl-coenzyme A thioesterase PaaI-like protein